MGEISKKERIMLLLRLTVECYKKEVDRVVGNSAYDRRVVKELKDKGYIKLIAKDNMRTLKITRKGVKWVEENMPELLNGYDVAIDNRRSQDVKARSRLLRVSEIISIYFDSEAITIPADKEKLERGNQVITAKPTFYSKWELNSIINKELNPSRYSGMLINQNEITIIYNMDKLIKWSKVLENKFAYKIIHLSEKAQMAIYGSDVGFAKELLTSNGGVTKFDDKVKYFTLNSSPYERCIYVPKTSMEIGTLLVIFPEIKELIDEVILRSFNIVPLGHEEKTSGLYAGKSDLGKNTILLWEFDLMKYKRLSSLTYKNIMNVLIICLSSQLELIKDLFGSNGIEVKAINDQQVLAAVHKIVHTD